MAGAAAALEVGAWVALGEQVGQISKLDKFGKCAVAILNGPTKVCATHSRHIKILFCRARSYVPVRCSSFAVADGERCAIHIWKIGCSQGGAGLG